MVADYKAQVRLRGQPLQQEHSQAQRHPDIVRIQMSGPCAWGCITPHAPHKARHATPQHGLRSQPACGSGQAYPLRQPPLARARATSTSLPGPAPATHQATRGDKRMAFLPSLPPARFPSFSSCSLQGRDKKSDIDFSIDDKILAALGKSSKASSSPASSSSASFQRVASPSSAAEAPRSRSSFSPRRDLKIQRTVLPTNWWADGARHGCLWGCAKGGRMRLAGMGPQRVRVFLVSGLGLACAAVPGSSRRVAPVERQKAEASARAV
jgi:hypothetical protein